MNILKRVSAFWSNIGLLLILGSQCAVTLAADTAVQLDADATVSILNRSARVQPDGSWRIDNVPANFGPVRVRATSVKNGITRSGQSDFVTIVSNSVTGVGPFPIGKAIQIPSKIVLSVSKTTLTMVGGTSQLTVLAIYADATTLDITPFSSGTSYTVSNPNVATVDSTGLVTAVASGTVLVSALNEGAVGIVQLKVVLSNADSDGDGIPDDVEIANGLNPNDPVDAKEDPDRDGLTNCEELMIYGTNPRVADSDGDGISDGDEVHGTLGKVTNPLQKDTDGDGINDLLEFQTGTDPTDKNSFNFGAALQSLAVTPLKFVLTVNSITGTASRQLIVTGVLRDGSTVDLTSTARGTNYSSSDLLIANFGSPDGKVFAGNNGATTIVVKNGSFSSVVDVTVVSSSPGPRGFVNIPGYANNVDVSGNYAYVAAGSAGLQVVDVSDRNNPSIVASLAMPGNATDVRVVGNLAYVADGPGGLQIVSILNPLIPTRIGSVSLLGTAYDVAVAGSVCYVADGNSGLAVVDVTIPSEPKLVGNYLTLGGAIGVGVSEGIAVVAEGTYGIEVLDITGGNFPQPMGSVAYRGNSQSVAISGPYAYIADSNVSLTVVNLANPRDPRILASTPLATGGRLFDVALDEGFAFGADKYFANLGVPIIDIENPAVPIPRAILSFNAAPDGTGIALDGRFVYLTADSTGVFSKGGTTGNSRLYIGQYLAVTDNLGVPPTVGISQPRNGSQIIQNQTITIHVAASDDVGIADVALYVNGLLLARKPVAPFDFIYTAPSQAGQVLFTATATDFGGNATTSPPTLIEVVSDPGTTATGRIVDANGQPVFGAKVVVFGSASAYSDVSGVFQLTGLSTIHGNIIAVVTKDLLFGESASFPVVEGGIVDLGSIVIKGSTMSFTKVLGGSQIIQSETILVDVITGDIPGLSVELLGNGASAGTISKRPFQFVYTAPSVAGKLTLTANGNDGAGNTVTLVSQQLDVVPDPGTTVTGKVVDENGRPVPGAIIYNVGGNNITTDSQGNFRVTGVSTIRGDIVVGAYIDVLTGESASFTPIPNGVTDVGTITLHPDTSGS